MHHDHGEDARLSYFACEFQEDMISSDIILPAVSGVRAVCALTKSDSLNRVSLSTKT